MADSPSEFDNSEDTKIWNNNNIFTKNISFSISQKFPILSLDYANHPSGSILFANGVNWDILKPNLTNQFLSFTSNGLQWQHLQFSNIHGVLPVSQGGTGWSILPEKGLFVNSAKEVLDFLPFPEEFNILSANNGEAEWIDFKIIVDEVSKKFKTINVINNIATLNNNNPILKLTDGNVASGLILNSGKGKISFSANSLELGEYNSSLNSLAFNLDIYNKKFDFKINESPVFTINEDGLLENCKITTEQVRGILPIEKGGVGNLNLNSGDLIFFSNENKFISLSTKDKEGCFLQVKDGIPQYSSLDKSFLDGNLTVPLVLDRTRNELPPLRFQRSSLLENFIEGSVEFDGYNLFLTTASGRKALSFMSSDISGNATNVTGIVSLKNGGTGSDLQDIAFGQLVYKNSNAFAGLEVGSYGQILMSQGQGALPSWTYVISDIEASIGSGIQIVKTGAIAKIGFDQAFSPVWQGKHKFLNESEFDSQILLNSKNKTPIKFGITKQEVDKSAGDLWFNGNELLFNTGTKTVSLTEKNNHQEYKQIHLLSLAVGNEIYDNKKIKMKTAVPYLPTNKNLAISNWKIKYLQMLTDDAPVDEQANFKLLLNDEVIGDIIIPLGGKDIIYNDFKNDTVISGQTLQLECIKSGGSNYWSAFLMIEII